MSKIFIAIVVIVLIFIALKRSAQDPKLIALNKENGQKFLEENAKNVNVKTTESGLQYEVLKEGTGKTHPKSSDKVKVHYHGTLIDGTVFDSSVERNQPLTFGLNQVIKGWTEGLQLMVEGEKARFHIPSELAYGNRATGNIPPAALLIFEVELLAIEN